MSLPCGDLALIISYPPGVSFVHGVAVLYSAKRPKIASEIASKSSVSPPDPNG